MSTTLELLYRIVRIISPWALSLTSALNGGVIVRSWLIHKLVQGSLPFLVYVLYTMEAD